MSIQITKFQGIRPALSDRHLSAEHATLAHNTALRDGTLKAYRVPVLQRQEAYDIKGIYLPPDTARCCASVLTWDHCVSVTTPALPSTCGEFDLILVWHHECGVTRAERVNPCSGETYPLVVPPPLLALQASLVRDTAQDNNKTGYGWNMPTDIYDPNSVPTQDPMKVDIYKGPDERTYTYTWVDQFGVESRPAPPSATFKAYDTQHWLLTGFSTPPPNAACVRIYRANSNLESGDKTRQPFETTFQLVDEVPVPFGQTYLDDKRLYDILWGTLLTTDHCDPPPCMTQVLETEQGFHVGFTGNTLYVSERMEPHNWPEKGRIELPNKVVAIACNGDFVYIATTGKPYRMSVAFNKTGDMADYTVDAVPYMEHYPCLSRESMVATTAGACYTSRRGIVFLEPNGSAKLVTRPRIDEDTWITYAPNVAAWHEGRYYGCRAPTNLGLVVDFRDAAEGDLDLGDFVTVDLQAQVMHAGRDDRLYFADGNKLYTWDEGDDRLVYVWRSKEFTYPALMGLGVYKIVSRFGPPVTIRLYASGELVYSYTVTSDKTLRLPAHNRHLVYQLELEGSAVVFEVHAATATWDLANEGRQAR